MTILHNLFEMGQTVFLHTDKDQLPRLVTGIRIRPGGAILYDLSSGATESVHYEMEIATDSDIMLTSTN